MKQILFQQNQISLQKCCLTSYDMNFLSLLHTTSFTILRNSKALSKEITALKVVEIYALSLMSTQKQLT